MKTASGLLLAMVAILVGMAALMGWLTALVVNFLFPAAGWTFWHGVVAWVAISVVAGLLRPRSRS